MASRTVERTTALAAPAADVWGFVTTWEGVNAELMPFIRMTVPRAVRGLAIGDVAAGTHAGRAWMLLGGVLPVDYDDLTLAEIEPGRRFLERSTMGSLRAWQHERVVEPAGPGDCTVTDRLTLEPRIPGTAGIAVRVTAALFAHRHRRLAKRFGTS